MIFRLRQIEYTGDGREIVREKDIAKPELTVGRSAQCDIHLPDLAVEPLHARIVPAGEGRIRIEAAGTLGFTIDGTASQSAGIDLRSGGELRFGGYRVAISPGADGAVLLTVQHVAQVDGSSADGGKTGFSLAGAMPGKRVLSWLLGIAILLAFLAVPIIGNLTRTPDAKSGAVGDGAWSSGPLSLAHHALETRCEACHVKPFEAVRDETCLSCHKDTHDHALSARIALARAEPGLGGKFLGAVAHGFGRPGPGSCTSCHVEHEGAAPLEPTGGKLCTDCHATLDQRLTDTRLGNAGDFGTLHPQFRPRIPTVAGQPGLSRISLDAHPREASGLTFPHKLHLDPLGGAARMAANIGKERGYGSRLACKDCHRPTEDGIRFQPVNMERDCESCHSLAYDRVGDTFRTLHHGDVAQMKADLRATPHGQVTVSGRTRPGQFAAGGLYYSSFSAPAGSEGRISRALSRDGVCGECHTPVADAGGMTIMPVTQVSRFMVNGWFDHKAHAQEKCSTCHAADKSESSADLLLPGIKQCRTCHLGESAAQAKVPSGCAMCHAYHPTALPPRVAMRDKE
jgi:predicted CXXCH cytochrome family protein